jgi:hypothetical protein
MYFLEAHFRRGTQGHFYMLFFAETCYVGLTLPFRPKGRAFPAEEEASLKFLEYIRGRRM